MPRRLAQQRMTLSDLQWLFHALRVISAVAELLVDKHNTATDCEYGKSTHKSTTRYISYISYT